MVFNQLTTPSFFTRYKPLFVGAAVALAVFVLGVGGYIVWSITTTSSEIPDEYSAVLSNLTDTLSGLEEEVASGDTDRVRIELERAAQETNSAVERGVLLLIAAQITMLDDPITGVGVYKAIATDVELSDSLRTIALNQLVLAYHNAETDSERDALTTAIFTEEEPFRSLRPLDESMAAREASYAGLLTYADDAAPTPFSSAHLARYWASKAFHATTTDEVAREEARMRAETYVTRTEWLLEFNTTTQTDLTIPTSEVVLGIAQTYLEALDNVGSIAPTGPAKITTGTEELSERTALLFAQYEQQSLPFTQQMTPAEISRSTHAIWKLVLETAVDLHESRPTISMQLADAYMLYISSSEGTAEQNQAANPKSDIADLIKTLQDAEILQWEAAITQ